MRIKKILSLAVVLAMVMAVVPMFGLTASAESTQTLTLFDIAKVPVSGHGDNTIKASDGWAGSGTGAAVWSTQWSENGVWNTDPWGATALMFFKTNDRGGNNGQEYTATFTDGKNYVGANKVVIEYNIAFQDVANNNNNGLYFSFSFLDSNAKPFAKVLYDRLAGVKVGGVNANNDGTAIEGVTTYDQMAEHRGSAYRIEATKGESGWTVTYSYKAVGAEDYTQIDAATETIDSMEGFGGIKGDLRTWSNKNGAMGFQGLKITAEFPESVKIVNAKYKANNEVVKTVTKTYDTETAQDVTFPAYDYFVDGESTIYRKTEETKLGADGDITLDAIANPDVDNAKDEATVTATNGKQYKLTGGNLIPNGDFSVEGNNLLGWLDGTLNQPTVMSANAGKGTITFNDANNGGNTRTGEKGHLYRSFPLEKDQLYIFTAYNSTQGDYNRVALGNDLGSASETELKAVYGIGNNDGLAYANAPAGQSYFAFRNTEDYKYLKIMYRWAGGREVGKFGLYKAEEVGSAKEVTPINDQTIIDGNIPAGMKNVVGLADGVSIQIDIPKKYETGDTIPVYDRLTGDAYSIPCNLTVLPCTDDSLAGTTQSVATKKFKLPAKKKVHFVFDLTYKNFRKAKDDAGSVGVFIGDTTSANDGSPAYNHGGNAIGLQGAEKVSDVNATELKVQFKGATDTFTVKKDERYRLYITAKGDDSLDHSYSAIVLDSNGNEVYNTATNNGGKDLTFRDSVDKLDAFVVSTNDSNSGDIVVENFRISAEGVEERTVPIKDDTGSQTVDSYKFMGYEDSTTTVPANIYGTQYYLDKAVENVTIADGTKANKLGLINWNIPNNAALKAWNYDTYNSGQVSQWNASPEANAYAYVNIPSKSEAQKYVIKITGKWPSGIDNNGGEGSSNAPGIGIDVLQKAELEKIDLRKGAEATKALDGLSKTTITENEGDGRFVPIPEEYVTGDTDKEFTVSYLVPDDKASALKAGDAALRLYPTRRGAMSIGKIEVVAIDVPENNNITPALGFNDEGLTIDFTLDKALGEGTRVEITRDGKTLEVTTDTAKAKGADDKVINLSTVNTNAIYTATVKTKVEGIDFVVGEAKTSLYKLVVDDISKNKTDYIAKDAQVNKERVAMAAEVITKGGVYYGDDGNLLPEVKEILTKSSNDESVVITVDKDLFGLGIGFMVKNGDEIYFGSEEKGTVSGAEGEPALYDKMTINVNENTVTFENTQATNLEAITLALDSVNIEFVETLIEELEAAGADADIALTPEL